MLPTQNGQIEGPKKGKQWSGAPVPKKSKKSKPEKVPESITIHRPIFGGEFEQNEEMVLKKTTRKIPKFEQIDHSGQFGEPYRKK